jgi:hypothetical protein
MNDMQKQRWPAVRAENGLTLEGDHDVLLSSRFGTKF